jgi:hypothetical protein
MALRMMLGLFIIAAAVVGFIDILLTVCCGKPIERPEEEVMPL